MAYEVIIILGGVNTAVRSDDHARRQPGLDTTEGIGGANCPVPPTWEDPLTSASLDPEIRTHPIKVRNGAEWIHDLDSMITIIRYYQHSPGRFGHPMRFMEFGVVPVTETVT